MKARREDKELRDGGENRGRSGMRNREEGEMRT
jgi:hypothetical protein